ncbi:MAG: hypothetical protein WAZ77_20765 [Candidatus Nitrosopolaris sp.]
MYTKKRYMVTMLPNPVCSTYDLNSDVVIGYHHHHHNIVRIHQSISQLNACDHSSCSNSGSNSASVDLPHHSSNDVRISQSIDQANLCSNSACSNTASNDASVH